MAIGSTDTERFTSSHPDHAGRWRWLLASFVPSSMVLAVTTHLTTDIAPVPLLWVIPLALYLLSFVVAFHAAPVPRGEPGESWGWRVGLPLFIAVWADEVRAPVWILASFHLGFCYLIGLACHRRLAADRPPVAELTRYYLYIAFGGVLGGFFNAILAPLLFHRSDELPLTVAAAAALLAWWPMRPGGSPVALTLGSSPPGGASTPPGIRRLRRLITLGAVITVGFLLRSRGRHAIDTSVGIALLLLVAVRAGRDRPRAISALGAAGLLAMLAVRPVDPHLLLRQRDFYGALEVTRTASDTARFLTHGNTFHGGQLTPFASRDVPLFYYHRDGPVGQVFEVVASRSRRLEIGVVGLGCGALAAYGRYGSRFTFYELDPKVVAIAEDPGLFTYLSDSKATIVVRTGDGRLGLADTATGTFDLLVIDAYNSDAIPVHLCTLEALDLYRSRLKPDGLLAVHLSHRFLDLESVFGALLWHRGMVGRSRTYRPTPVMPASGTPTFLDDHAASSCSWTVLANRVEDLGTLATDGRWRPVRWTRRSPLWTDDHQPLLMIYTWD